MISDNIDTYSKEIWLFDTETCMSRPLPKKQHSLTLQLTLMPNVWLHLLFSWKCPHEIAAINCFQQNLPESLPLPPKYAPCIPWRVCFAGLSSSFSFVLTPSTASFTDIKTSTWIRQPSDSVHFRNLMNLPYLASQHLWRTERMNTLCKYSSCMTDCLADTLMN